MSRSTRTPAHGNERPSRRRFLRDAGAAAVALGCGGALWCSPAARAQGGAGIATSDLGGGLILLQGAGANVVALAGPNGALMIDGGLAGRTQALLAAAYEATGTERVELLINTHWHPEQTGANETVGRAGATILAHEKTRLYLSHTVYAMQPDGTLAPVAPLPEPGRPTEAVRNDGSREFAGRRLDYGYLPAAHTDGDLYVHFPQANVLVAGGVVSAERWPLIDYRNGAWLGGRVRALQWLAKLVRPDTRVVPADGRVLTGRDIERQRALYDELFETMIGYMNKGFGPEDAVASNPLAAYEAEFGSPATFLDGAYRSMLIAYVPD